MKTKNPTMIMAVATLASGVLAAVKGNFWSTLAVLFLALATVVMYLANLSAYIVDEPRVFQRTKRQRGGEEIVSFRLPGGAFKAHFETKRASRAALRLRSESFYQPLEIAVAAVYRFYAELIHQTLKFRKSFFALFDIGNIRIIVKSGDVEPLRKPLDTTRRAGSAAAVQQKRGS